MTKIDIFSGFLGAGKTTLIKKLVKEAYAGEKLVIIENEFGDIGIDGGFLEEAGIQVTEMNSGCICCSLVGDFGKALKKVVAEYAPDRIVIEPSGVGKLSDVIRAVEGAGEAELCLNSRTAVVDAKKCKMYMKNFSEFFNNQIESAGCIVLSHTAGLSDEKLAQTVSLIRSHNADAQIVTAEWDELTGDQIRAAMEKTETLEHVLRSLREEEEHHHHHHHDGECDDPDCACHHHHDDDDDDDDGDEDEHHHHHHHHDDDDDDDEDEHEHHHHHHHHHDHDDEEHEHHHHHHHHHHHGEGECDDPECSCHDHGHHHHHADEVFTSWGKETSHKFTKEELEECLKALENESEYGMVLRAKGIVSGEGCWYHFDYTPGEADVRVGGASTIGRLCVIGSKINEDKLSELFR